MSDAGDAVSPIIVGGRLDARADRIMKDVVAVLDPNGAGEMSVAQKRLFKTIAVRFAHFELKTPNPVSSVIDHVGHHWRNWLLLILYTGTFRPSKISRLLKAVDPRRPISHRMLTHDLRVLERDGLVVRTVINSTINHVEYSLSEIGSELVKRLIVVMEYVGDNAHLIAAAQDRFDAENESY